ncbi:MAG TPA: hypothetical protein VKU89_08170 [Solirubrobacteraceae bacterium]|nr:hypothetical protein [Solirubrobacteraceae bacterium]
MPAREETAVEQLRPTQLQLAGTAELREDSRKLSGEASQLHRDMVERQLTELAHSLERHRTADLLERLAASGFAWSTLAEIFAVTPTAVRKWRRGDTPTPEHHRRVAHLLAAIEMLRKANPLLEDIAYWLEARCEQETTLRRLDLYRMGSFATLHTLASGRMSAREALEEAAPDWRARHRRDERFELVWHDDGSPSIVMRGEKH